MPEKPNFWTGFYQTAEAHPRVLGYVWAADSEEAFDVLATLYRDTLEQPQVISFYVCQLYKKASKRTGWGKWVRRHWGGCSIRELADVIDRGAPQRCCQCSQLLAPSCVLESCDLCGRTPLCHFCLEDHVAGLCVDPQWEIRDGYMVKVETGSSDSATE